MKKVFFALMLGLAAVACTKEYDDSALKNQLGNLEDRVEAIEEEIATLTNEVNGMKTLAQALRDGKYITSYEAYAGEDGRTGYTLKFSDNSTVVVYNGVKGDQGIQGEQGEQGPAPELTVAEKDGELYWYVGTEPMAPVYEAAPVFTSKEGKLYVQFGEQEPVEVGTLTGKSIFEDVKVEGENMVFTFLPVEGETEGYSVSVPLTNVFALVIRTEVGLAEGATAATLPYTVKGANAATVVDFIAFGCKAALTADAIEVTEITEGAYLLVFADNQEGKTSIKKVAFAAESVTIETVDYFLPIEGGQVVVNGDANVDLDVVIPAEATWLTVVETKSAFTFTFVAEVNEVYDVVRQAEVAFVRAGTEEVLKTVTIAQAAPEKPLMAEKVWSINVPFSGGVNRNMATDGEYIYVAQAGAAAIKAIEIANTSNVINLNVTGVEGGLLAMACVRVLPNNDPNVNGGKPVVMATNLSSGGANLSFYVWSNGIENAPTKQTIGTGDRRLGDKFTVRGSYQSGALWFWDFTRAQEAMVRFDINNGKFGVTWDSGATYYASGRWAIPLPNVANSTGEVTAHPDATFSDGLVSDLVATTNISDGYFKYNGAAENTYELVAWTEGKDPGLDHAWGFNFFEFNGKDYIAYIKLINDRTNATINIIKDINGAADFKGTLEAKEGLLSIQLLEENGAAAQNGVGDCVVFEKNGKTYVAGMLNNNVISLYELN